VRDVAYAQIPRVERVRKHEAAANWIEAIAGDRIRDYAELLAHHYREALRLARAAALPVDRLEDAARRFFQLAGERAAGLDEERARALFDEALELAPSGHPERGRILAARVEFVGTWERDELEVLDEAIAELRTAGDEVGVGKAMLLRSHRTWTRGDSAIATELLSDARALLERHEPGPELAHAYSLSAGRAAIRGDAEVALGWAERAMALAERLGLENYVLRSRQFRGIARCDLGDFGGLDDLRESLRISLERGLTREADIGFNNYGSWLWLANGAEEALAVYREGIAWTEKRGGIANWQKAESTYPLFDLGLWDELLEFANVVERDPREGQPKLMAGASKGRVLFYRARTDEAAELAADLLPRARAAGDPQVVDPVFSLAALVEPDAGKALALLEELLTIGTFPTYPDCGRVCVRHGAFALAERLTEQPAEAPPRAHHVAATIRAIVAEARGEREQAVRLYSEAAARWQAYPFVLERGLCLLGARRFDEAAPLLRSLGAEALLAAA
jgi:tetratricopeptide (TPR) repeat protein